MASCYKTLFEVKIFHEYYLTNPDGETVFDHVLQKDRINFLRDRFTKDETNINAELAYVLPASEQDIFKNHRLRLLTNYAGFKVVVEVNTLTLPDGTKTYQPKIPLRNDDCITILLTKKNNAIDGYTNSRMNRQANSFFYFSNEEFLGAKVFPSLSNGIPGFDASFPYEQGELASHGVNDVRAFYKDSTNTIQWLPLVGSSYANESDRLLVPLGFFYSMSLSDNVTTVDFTLKDSSNVVVAEYHFSQPSPIQKVFIAVNGNDVVTVSEASPSAELVYTLDVAGSGGYHKILKLIFYEEKEEANVWAMVHIKPKTINSNFDLLDATGSLITKRKPDGTFNPLHPVFEIRVKSRITFWRYINEEGNNFQQNLHADQLELNVGKLVSKKPRSLSFSPVFYKKLDNSAYYLPNPKPYTLLRSESGQLYSDVYVSESKDLFPLGP